MAASTNGVAEIVLSGGKVALIDEIDLHVQHTVELRSKLFFIGTASDRKWQQFDRDHTTYARFILDSRFEVRLHRLVMDARKGQIVDHINRNGLDNRRENLRVVSAQLNSVNRGPNANGKFKGISFSKSQGKWHAHIRISGRKRHLGTFATPEEAAAAYDSAAIQVWGDDACTNQKLGLIHVN